ncbi:DUF2971 domain-containing protein [Aliivibrio sp. S4TY2]|uniref:DUF2971 domain-containing protein n=1 Tax=unclassified Aliivibrio TaxID=2645654 RepID=UPI0023783DE6|nr:MULTISPECIES: DUF2971 domain-containing protein [unclassified Aliivibrio]MDD9158511.1 DUF2971 domain-containing protein [Aliivibrio sp. S4TY2]MDD9162511.1 DUF2971 domain-containing protein [Aliivibrio sp. S4TY1]MDD9166509.1 DUF2971 domain-containing protein [Aliivibrio sp. S4MY2]MDD9170508.1 DUF2971 domain-containing protein [Aliivibrio sp. S4MY4]MDD9187586.1 DUF2971 domain-containing protein [Aliivibrio sp. S4MY3]
MIYYKYRSLDNLKFLIDIFMNNRLYAAPYTSMNDPMEGHYFQRSGRLSSEFKSALKGEKDACGIVSLSEIPDNTLMWAHYANGHNGIAIGVEIDSNLYDIRPIEYDGLSQLTQRFENEPAEAAKRVLSHKLEVWDYEKEHRVFVQYEKFVNVKIKEVVFGRRVEPEERKFFEKLFTKLSHDGIQFKTEQRT